MFRCLSLPVPSRRRWVQAALLGGGIALGSFVTHRATQSPSAKAVAHPVAAAHAVPNWPAPLGLGGATASGASTFVEAANTSVHAVVHVQTASVVADMSNPWLAMFGLASGRVAQGSGSGVILNADGTIVTNHHVIEGADQVVVSTSDGQTHAAKVLGSDPSTDLALLQIEPTTPLHALRLGNSDELQVGEWVLAVGNPFNLTSTVTAGIVSAKGRNLRLLEPDAQREVYPVESFIQTDAAVNPGNSGGALVNLRGELVGINTAIASRTGSYAGYSFAIPASIVGKVARDLKEFGRVQRAYLGIQVESLPQRVRVAAITPGGGAEEAGLQPGDELVSVNGIPTRSFPALQEQLSKHRPGDRVSVTWERRGERTTREVVLKNREGDANLAARDARTSFTPSSTRSNTTAQPATKLPPSSLAWSATWRPMNEAERSRHRVRGGVILDSLKDQALRDAGLVEGFVLLRIDGKPVSTPDELHAALQGARERGERGVLVEGMHPNGQAMHVGIPISR